MVDKSFDKAFLSVSMVAYTHFVTLPINGLECLKIPIILRHEKFLRFVLGSDVGVALVRTYKEYIDHEYRLQIMQIIGECLLGLLLL